jgi:DNA polymerase-3 subunit beta
MFTLTTKLVDGKFPDYDRVIPKDGDKVVLADKQELRQALSRTAILSNEKFRGIRVSISTGQLQLSANNPEQEEAEETVSVDYQGDSLEVGFNVSYLQDVLGVIGNDKVRLTLHDANSSAVLEDPEREDAVYVVMPMKL